MKIIYWVLLIILIVVGLIFSLEFRKGFIKALSMFIKLGEVIESLLMKTI